MFIGEVAIFDFKYGRLKSFLRKFLKVILWILGSIITILLLLLLLIQIPAVQNFIKDEAVSFIHEKIETPVRIDNLEIGFPKKIILSGFYFEDQKGDTLAAGERLAVNIDFYKLLSSSVQISSIELEGAVANITRSRDSVFNFDYIIEAFATETPQDTTAAMEISIGTVGLKRVSFKWDDALSESKITGRLQMMDAQIGVFDPDQMIYEVEDLKVEGISVSMDQGIVAPSSTTAYNMPSEPTEEETTLPDLRIGDISIKTAAINYNNQEIKLNSSFNFEELITRVNKLQLANEFADIDFLELTGFKANILFNISEESAEVTQDTTSQSQPDWKVQVGRADLKDLDVQFKDENSPAVSEGMNFMDMELSNLNLESENLYYQLDSISGKINSFTLRDKSGLEIRSFKTEFLYSENSAFLKNLYLETPNTVLQNRIGAEYSSLESLQNDLGEVYLDANLENSKLAFEDILLLAPQLRSTNPFQSNPNAIVNINGKVSGKVNDLFISNFEADGIGATSISVSGNIKGMPDVASAYYNLNILGFQTTSRDLNQFLPPGIIPDSIQLPERLSLKGNFNGTAQNFRTKMNLNSSSGNAVVDAEIDMRSKGSEKYDANVTLQEFDLGRLMQNDSIGNLSLNIEARGTGFEPATANTSFTGIIQEAGYNSYIYKDIEIEGSIQNGDLTTLVSSQDANLDFDLDITGNFAGEFPSIKATADLRNVALDSLNLYGSPIKFQGTVSADLRTADPDHLNGEIILSNFIAANATQSFPLDSISLISFSGSPHDSLVLRSQFINADIKGNYQLTKIGPALSNTISKYYNLSSTPYAISDTLILEPQELSFDIRIEDDPMFNELIPELDFMEPISITGRYSSLNDSILVNGNIPNLRYLDYKLANSTFNIENTDSALSYDFIIDDVSSPQLQLFHTELSGKIQDNSVSYNLQIDDSKGDPHYRVAGLMETEDGSNRFTLEIDNLLLNYDLWTIPQDNSITVTPSGVQATNFNLSHDNNAIRINSESQDPSSPMEIEFENFRIETISAMISKDTLLAGGTINGDVILNNLYTSPEFTSELSIENFSFKRDTVGDLAIRVDNLTANTLEAKIDITGNGNDVELSGLYATDTGNLDFDLDLRHLNIKSIQGFSFGNITDGSGHLSGDLKLEGTMDSPVILGEMEFNDVAFKVTPLNSIFQSINDNINFSENGIELNNFTIQDDENNELVIDGTLNTRNYMDFDFGLSISADNFRAMNSTAVDNELYYGVLVLDTRLNVSGNLDQPVVNGNINIKEGTDLTVVLPQEDPTIADREGVVQFTDERSLRLAAMEEMKENLNTSPLQGMDVSINIEINNEAKLTLIIDEGNGDYLNLQGDAQLTAGIDPSGKTTLVGRYEFSEGAYEMSFNFIRRRFEIEENSYILWTGEPTTADINITAIYETEAPPIDLLGNQLGNLSPAVRNTYKQELPFQTLLQMRGELLEPVLTFDIRLPERNYNVSTDIINNTRVKLTQIREQPSELNKQVFALLLLNRFIGENPFSSEGGGSSAESLARQSVSKILSQQLNDLAGDLIGGVELNFDLDSTEDYTTGQREQRTDLNVGLSRRLLNDRLKVTIGSSFGLEGPQQSNQQANNIAGDIALDYQLSKDGRYMLRAYRKNQYQVALQGQIIETGVGFIITMDYNYFMEIFGKNVDK